LRSAWNDTPVAGEETRCQLALEGVDLRLFDQQREFQIDCLRASSMSVKNGCHLRNG